MIETISRRALLTLVCAVSALAVPAGASAAGTTGCNSRENNSPSKLVECIKTADLYSEMQDLENIAKAYPGPDGKPSRNSGEPGYKASADYVANLMKQAGYNVTIQEYPFEYFAYQGIPEFSNTTTGQSFAPSVDWNPGASRGTADAPVEPVLDDDVPDPQTGGATAGCEQSDFPADMTGKVALIQRGTCTFSTKAANAVNAGAVGVIIYNQGNTEARKALFAGSLSSVVPIPVAFVPWQTGEDLLHAAQSGSPQSVHLKIQAISETRPDYNVIADSKYGDPNRTVVVDAHLDAIYGEGMLDNASGSVSILDIAQKLAKTPSKNHLRFIWFGGEELGLLGSQYYVNNLSQDELNKTIYDLDADVMATPNYVIGVLDPAGPGLFSGTTTDFPPNVYAPSQASRDLFNKYFDSIGKNHIVFNAVGTDAFSFNMAGIPAGGLLTGQDCCKTQEWVDKFGGTTGNFEGNLNSFDGGCVDNPFRWCDNLDNNDFQVMTFMTKAFADVVSRISNDSTIVPNPSGGPGNGKPGKGKAQARAQAARYLRHHPVVARGRHGRPLR